MDSFKDVLEAAQAYCKTQMAEPTYNLYIDGLEPISFEDSSHITLSVRNDFICKIVTDRYLGLLKEAFKTVLGFDVDITLVVPSTPPHEVVLAQQYEANPASPQGNYEFTFENFIKGPSNQFAFAAHRRLRPTLRRIQPAVHLRRLRPWQDPSAHGHPDRDQAHPPRFRHHVRYLRAVHQ